MAGLKNKFVSGVIWESFGKFSSLGIQFLVTILIARILTPEEFGVVGLLTIFIAISSILVDSGFSQALIQKKEATKLDLSSIYFLNIFIGFVIYIIMFFVSPLIAEFYGLPELTFYSRVLFLIIPINSFGLIQNVIILKELDFKKTASASLIATILSGIVGIYMAYNEYGVWSLIGQQISMNLTRTLMYIIQRRWMPMLKISYQSIKGLFGFSINLMMHSIVNITMKNIYTLFIGKYFSVTEVGYYNQANKFEDISASTLTSVVIKVSYPALVHKKEEPELLKNAYINIFSTTIFFIAPLMVYLMVIAQPLFNVLLTSKWLPAATYFQILCIYGMVLPILQISYNVYKLYRKGRTLLYIDTVRHFLVVLSILITFKYGVQGMLIGLAVITICMAIVNLYYSGKLISLSVSYQLLKLTPYYLIALVTGAIIYFIPIFNNQLLYIFITGIAYLIIYLYIMRFFKLKGFTEALNIFRSIKNKLIK